MSRLMASSPSRSLQAHGIEFDRVLVDPSGGAATGEIARVADPIAFGGGRCAHPFDGLRLAQVAAFAIGDAICGIGRDVVAQRRAWLLRCSDDTKELVWLELDHRPGLAGIQARTER